MSKFRKNAREKSSRIHAAIQNSLAPILQKWLSKTRYPSRKRLFQRWGRKHPKKAASYYFAILILLLGWNVISMIIQHDKDNSAEKVLNLDRFASSKEVFDGMMTINRNREAIRESMSEYATLNLEIANRLDSLMSLPQMTHADSLEAARLYKSLNLNHNTNNP